LDVMLCLVIANHWRWRFCIPYN